MSSPFVAGKLIRQGGAVSRAVRAWYESGARPHCWNHARGVLHELWPEAKTNSIEAVIRLAQACVAVGRVQRKRPPDWCPPPGSVPDARRLIRDAYRSTHERGPDQ